MSCNIYNIWNNVSATLKDSALCLEMEIRKLVCCAVLCFKMEIGLFSFSRLPFFLIVESIGSACFFHSLLPCGSDLCKWTNWWFSLWHLLGCLLWWWICGGGYILAASWRWPGEVCYLFHLNFSYSYMDFRARVSYWLCLCNCLYGILMGIACTHVLMNKSCAIYLSMAVTTIKLLAVTNV